MRWQDGTTPPPPSAPIPTTASQAEPSPTPIDAGASSWGDARWLDALWTLPVLALVFWYSWRQRRRAASLITPVSRPSRALAITRAALALLAIAAITLALARPRANPREEGVAVTGRDLVFVVDVSRSMLARDLLPSRLAKAKLWINDLVRQLKGDRVALVAFAGSSSVACPLTLDYDFFRMALEELSPESVARGGTLIGDALRKVNNDVLGDDARPTDIVLVTDGDDQESFPVEAAKALGERGVRIIALGLGSELGSTIPTRENAGKGETIRQNGREITSKLDANGLQLIATATPGGAFLPIGTGTVNLDRVYRDLLANAERVETGTRSTIRYDERFQVLLAAAFVLLMVEALMGLSWARQSQRRVG